MCWQCACCCYGYYCYDRDKWLGQVLCIVGNYKILHIVVTTLSISKYLHIE